MNATSINHLAKLKGLFDAIEVFREFDPSINVLTIQAALEVARKGDNGVSVKNLEKLLGCSSSAASRNLLVLEEKNTRNPKGLGIAEPAFDPLDPKGKLRKPTAQMDVLVEKLIHALS